MLAHGARVAIVESEPPHARVHAVRSEDEVVVVGRAVVELGHHLVPVGRQRDRTRSPGDRHVAGSGQQHVVQVRARQGQARADTAPDLVDADLEQQARPLVGEALSFDPVRPVGDVGFEAQLSQRAYGVAGQVDPRALTRRRRGSFDQPHRGAGPVQGPGGCQAGQAGTDDEHPDALEIHRRQLPSDGSMFWLIRNRLWGS